MLIFSQRQQRSEETSQHLWGKVTLTLTSHSLPLHRPPLFLKISFSLHLLLQVVAAIVSSFQVLKFLGLWLHDTFSVRSASSTPFLFFHSLFCKQQKKWPAFPFLSESQAARRGKKSLSCIDWLKCLFLQMTENQYPTAASVFQKYFDWQRCLANAEQSL